MNKDKQALGLKVVDENYREARNSYKCVIALPDGTQPELFSFDNPPPRSSRPEAQGLRHLAFTVEDMDSTVAYLNSCGIEREAIRVDPYTQCRYTFFSDPDHLPLELVETF